MMTKIYEKRVICRWDSSSNVYVIMPESEFTLVLAGDVVIRASCANRPGQLVRLQVDGLLQGEMDCKLLKDNPSDVGSDIVSGYGFETHLHFASFGAHKVSIWSKKSSFEEIHIQVFAKRMSEKEVAAWA